MKRFTTIMHGLLAGTLLSLSVASAEATPVRNVTFSRSGSDLVVELTVDFSSTSVRSSQALLLTPILVGKADTARLRPVAIYGRQRYIDYQRNHPDLLTCDNRINYRASNLPDTLRYRTLVPYAEWMDGARLTLDARTFGCCNTLTASASEPLGRYEAPLPAPVAVVQPDPAPAEKIFTLTGNAYVCFPLDQSILYDDFMNNPLELAKIRAGIDSLEAIPGLEVKAITLKGFASPEGTYAHNTDLARNRTQALKQYIDKLYHFEPTLVSIDFEPEDWAGLHRWVAASQLPHRDEILAIIESPLEPDAREARIKASYPQEYATLLAECYPRLRHTEYTIAFTVRRSADAPR